MTPTLVYILGAIHISTPMANMDACNAALRGLDVAARFRSYCIDGRTGETIYARKITKHAPNKETPEPIVSNEKIGWDGEV